MGMIVLKEDGEGGKEGSKQRREERKRKVRGGCWEFMRLLKLKAARAAFEQSWLIGLPTFAKIHPHDLCLSGTGSSLTGLTELAYPGVANSNTYKAKEDT